MDMDFKLRFIVVTMRLDSQTVVVIVCLQCVRETQMFLFFRVFDCVLTVMVLLHCLWLLVRLVFSVMAKLADSTL